MLGMLSFIACVAGIVCFYLGLWPVTVFASILNIFSQFSELRIGKQTNLVTAILACVVGLIISCWSDLSWWLGICVALCFEDVITTLAGWIMTLVFLFKK